MIALHTMIAIGCLLNPMHGTEMYSFFRLENSHEQFVPDSADIAMPLNNQLSEIELVI